jgi:hypothetical protein
VKFLQHWLLPVRLSALILAVLAVGFGVMSLRLGFWGDGIPGSGLIPFIGCVLLLPITIVLLWVPLDPTERDGLRLAPLIGLIVLGIYVLVLPRLGFAVATAALIFVWIKWLHGRKWFEAAAGSIAISGLMLFLFDYVLGVPLNMWPDWS